MISSMKEDSHPLLLWLGIVSIQSWPIAPLFRSNLRCPQFPLGFGNAVVLQTMLSECQEIQRLEPETDV